MPNFEPSKTLCRPESITAFAQPQPSETMVRQAVSRISSSGAFARSPQLISFLNFIIDEEVSGRGDRLKGYTIGVQALGRSKEFDPNIDPIVRVEARRLRLALKSYYAFEGLADHVVIDLPVGSYRPMIKALQADAPAEKPDVPIAPWPGPVLSPVHVVPKRRFHNPDFILRLILVTVVLNQLMLWIMFLISAR
jgi:hypothetical protein